MSYPVPPTDTQYPSILYDEEGNPYVWVVEKEKGTVAWEKYCPTCLIYHTGKCKEIKK